MTGSGFVSYDLMLTVLKVICHICKNVSPYDDVSVWLEFKVSCPVPSSLGGPGQSGARGDPFLAQTRVR